MAPLSLAGTALQPHSLVSYTVFPLVMVAPAVAALLCWLAVPGWFPADAPHAAAGRVDRTVIGLGAASAVVVAVIMPFGAGRPMILSERLPTAPTVVAVIAGLTVGSLCEETGYPRRDVPRVECPPAPDAGGGGQRRLLRVVPPASTSAMACCR